VEQTEEKQEQAYSRPTLPLQYFVTVLRVTLYQADLKTSALWARHFDHVSAIRGDRAGAPADRNVNRDFYSHPIRCHNVDMS
jgi:hypothetical protein